MTDTNREVVFSVRVEEKELVGQKKCKETGEVLSTVRVERDINDLLDTQAAQEVLDLLKAD